MKQPMSQYYWLESLRVKNIFVFFMLFSGAITSQNQQIELAISNDKFVLSDRYYTSGLHLTYRSGLDEGFLFLKSKNGKIQLNVTLGNETYTPKNLRSFDNAFFDRPYAGWLFGKVELVKIKPASAFFYALESGITGKESYAGKLQIAIHEFLNIDSRPTWQDEITFKWLFNFKASYIKHFQLNTKSAFQNNTQISLGSKDTFIANTISFFWGNFSEFQDSYRSGFINVNQTKEFFGFASAGYKYVALNALIQGSAFQNRDPFTAVAVNHILELSFGGVFKFKKHLFKLGYYYNSKETVRSTYHIYGALTYGLVF